MKQTIREILKLIASDINRDTDCECLSYIQQRQIINSLFEEYDKEDYGMAKIILRLTVIDSLYSTNAAYSYFSIEEMAEKIMSLGTERMAADYFYEIATGKVNGKILFDEFYGIRKNLSHGSKQMSLLSKYAYYLLLQDVDSYPLGFPIYDSLAIESYPKVCSKAYSMNENQERKNIGASIKVYVSAINELREKIFGNNEPWYGLQQFDLLDAYLWRLGKLENGNCSLLLDRKDYETFIINLGLAAYQVSEIPLKSDKFNDAVRDKCLGFEKDYIQGISNETFVQLMKHWLKVYHNKVIKS